MLSYAQIKELGEKFHRIIEGILNERYWIVANRLNEMKKIAKNEKLRRAVNIKEEREETVSAEPFIDHIKVEPLEPSVDNTSNMEVNNVEHNRKNEMDNSDDIRIKSEDTESIEHGPYTPFHNLYCPCFCLSQTLR